MAEDDVKQRLAAILAADVAGYTRLMREDERATIATIKDYRERFRVHIEANTGRVVDMAGDSVLAVFESAAGAVSAAVAIQRELGRRNAELPAARRMHFRIGINLGDIQEAADGTIYGDGVNIAARMEGLAEPGGVMLSDSAHMQVRRSPDLAFADAGTHRVKNVDESVRAHRVVLDGGAVPKRTWRRRTSWYAVAIMAVVAIGIWRAMVPPAIETASVERMAYPLPAEPSIAVLPFDNLSGDPEHEFIADGLTENIIGMLAQAPNMLVIARNSTFIYKGKAVDVREVAEQQSVRYVLEGSIQISGETMRVTAQLIDALEGVHAWAGRFERPLQDLFSLQDEITLEIVRAMQVELVSGETALTMSAGTTNLEAWMELQKAIALAYQYTPQSNLRARQGLERVLELDPDSAVAHVLLGWTYSWSARMFGSDTFDADIARSMALAEAAIALDPNLPGAYNLIAMGLHVLGRTEEALSNANYAVGIGPNNGQAMVPAAAVHLYAGRYERAAALLQHAERLTPVPDVILLLVRAMNFNALGDYPAAEAYARRVIAILPAQNNIGHRELLFALVQSGQMDEATKLANHLLAVDPEFSTASVRRRFELCCRSPAALVDEYVKALSEAGIP